MEGFIVLHRKLLEWEWADDPLTGWLWVHLLLRANHEDKKWRGIVIKRGQLVTGLEELACQTGLSIQQVRTRLDRLIKCGCITKQSSNKYTIITICKYSDYQDLPEENNKQITNKQQTNNKQITTNNNDNNNNISSSSYTACTCEENSSGGGSVLIESGLNKWKRSDIVTKGAIPELTDIWIEEVERLVLRFNKQGITEEAVRSYYEDFKAQEVTETLETTYHEWRKHFGNFVRKSIKQQEEETKKQKEIVRHGANQDYNSESARAARLEGAAQVMRELYENGKQYYREVPDR
jgi:hypothetical protein